MQAFIVRPFGVKNDIDFDAMQDALIAPALEEAGIDGSTTAVILEPGNIREDMFQLLLTAELVIADITIHNANVYYELGIRHALRKGGTVMIRGVSKPDEELKPDAVPFDILTDRYLAYDLKKPAASVATLAETIRRTAESDGVSSPVFRLLPGLKSQGTEQFLAAPRGFQEELEWRSVEGQPGDLELLTHEVRGLPWEKAGLRLIGRMQLLRKHYRPGALTWEAIRDRWPDDIEANQKLATIYQKLGSLTRSDQAAERAAQSKELTPWDRAEAFALMGSNHKTRWMQAWADQDTQKERRRKALQSPWLDKAVAAYAEGNQADLNHYYSGINALALIVVQTELAKELSDEWAISHDSDLAAQHKLQVLEERAKQLGGALRLALDCLENGAEKDKTVESVWRSFTLADLEFLTAGQPARVAGRYQQAADLGRQLSFTRSSVERQIRIFEQLGLRSDLVPAALEAVGGLEEDADPVRDIDQNQEGRILVFTGHRVDDEGRSSPRFPCTREAEDQARQAIEGAVQEEMSKPVGVACALAGGASGGDILFHEVCEGLGIQTQLYVAMPREDYVRRSVQSAGNSWVDRFNDIFARCNPRTLQNEDALPGWLKGKSDYDIWQRNNLWLLHNALAVDPSRVTLIALWDGEPTGDGPGGTSHMVQLARDMSANVVHLNTKELFGLV